jgi:hypothetical protein
VRSYGGTNVGAVGSGFGVTRDAFARRVGAGARRATVSRGRVVGATEVEPELLGAGPIGVVRFDARAAGEPAAVGASGVATGGSGLGAAGVVAVESPIDRDGEDVTCLRVFCVDCAGESACSGGGSSGTGSGDPPAARPASTWLMAAASAQATMAA